MATIDPRRGVVTGVPLTDVVQHVVNEALGRVPGGAPAPRTPSTPVEPFFRDADFARLTALVHRQGVGEVRVVRANSTSGGPTVEGFVSNDTVEIGILITDAQEPALLARYHRTGSRFLRELHALIDSEDFALRGVEVREGSLWVWLKIQLRRAWGWLRDNNGVLRWLQSHKEDVAFWTDTIAKFVRLVGNLLNLLWWFFFGDGGPLPGFG
ncbi:hypothetical protein ACFYNO_22520 [Kitasatospora sp. NPDC006697]|uniref:hypothetical protein n=1 Tax=Kitasatospora sp. NPDC006697 TaxID=3364020 RepID=UPI0036D0A2B2